MTKANVGVHLIIREAPLQQSWESLLRRGGWSVTHAPLTEAADIAARFRGIILLDLAELGGTVKPLASLRSSFRGLPLILTSRSPLPDSLIAESLEAGVDDYIPESQDERLRLAKIRSHMRRLSPAGPAELLASPRGDLRVDLTLGVVEIDDGNDKWRELSRLTPIERRLLRLFLNYAGAALDRNFIAENVWQERAVEILPATIDKHVEALRRKLGSRASRVRTLYGAGYGYIEEGA